MCQWKCSLGHLNSIHSVPKGSEIKAGRPFSLSLRSCGLVARFVYLCGFPLCRLVVPVLALRPFSVEGRFVYIFRSYRGLFVFSASGRWPYRDALVDFRLTCVLLIRHAVVRVDTLTVLLQLGFIINVWGGGGGLRSALAHSPL